MNLHPTITGARSSKLEKDYWHLTEYSKLVTPYQVNHLPVYRWYTYKHSFSRNLVSTIINKYNLGPGDVTLDPFCGAGTTLLASKESGIRALGLDLMPLSILATNVKLRRYSKKRVLEIYHNLIRPLRPVLDPQDLQPIEMLKKYFPKGYLERILSLKSTILQIEEKKYRELFLLSLLSILEELSFTRKDGAFIRTVEKKHISSVEELFEAKTKQIIDDLSFSNGLPRTRSKAMIGDARKTTLKSSTISSVITSPPYPNRHDYTRIYLLELMIGFLEDYEQIKELRYRLIRSHVEAREQYSVEDYVPPKSIEKDIEELRKKDLPNQNVIRLVDGYFKDMYLTIKEMYRVLENGGTMHIVLGDSRYGGVNIFAGEYVTEIAKNIGFEHLETIRARDKGNSPQQMGRYGKTFSLESIISLRKG